jgi:hypothetical protein
MNIEKRKLAEVDQVSAKANYTGGRRVVQLDLFGANKAKKPLQFSATIDFYQVPWLVDELRKVWLEERRMRVAEISDVDDALSVKEAQP